MNNDEAEQFVDQHALRTRPDQLDNSPIEWETLKKAQLEDGDFRRFHDLVEHPNSEFKVQDGLLCRTSPIDSCVQVVVPRSLINRLLYLSHDPVLQGHPGITRMYDTLRQHFYWPLMYGDIEYYVATCRSCAKTRGTIRQHQAKLQLFRPNGPLEDVAVDLLGPLPRTKNHKRFILVINDRYTKTARAIPMEKTTAPHVAAAFLNNWVFPYGIPKSILSDNGPQFISEFFEYVLAVLGVKRIGITAYHPETNGQTERYNKTLAARLRHYINEHQTNWDTFVQPLTYAYNCQIHRTTGTSPFSLTLTRHPPNNVVETAVTASPALHVGNQPTQTIRGQILDRLSTMFARAEDRMIASQQRYKTYSDRRRGNRPAIDVGSEVFVDCPKTELKTVQEKEDHEAKSKLLPKSVGPFKVVQAFENVVVIRDNNVNVPVSIDRCTPAPPSRSPPVNPNSNTTAATSPTTPIPALSDSTDHPDVTPTSQPDAVSPPANTIARILSHTDHMDGRTTYNVQMADATRPRHVPHASVPADLLASYWMHVARPPKNPHMRRRGRPRKSGPAPATNPALVDARYYASE